MLSVWFVLQPEDFGFVAGMVFGLLALLALLALCLLWFFCPLITGVRNMYCMYSSKFLWHNIFMNFVVNFEIMKILFTN